MNSLISSNTGRSKHETFGQRLCRDMLRWGRERSTLDELMELARAGRPDEAVCEAQRLHSALEADLCLSAIAGEQACSGDSDGARSTVRFIGDSLRRAEAYTRVAEERNRQRDSEGALAALADALLAAKHVRGKIWRALTLGKIALVQVNAGASQDARATCQAALQAATTSRAEGRDQPLARIVKAMCLCGELERAAATLELVTAPGSRASATCELALALVAQGDTEDGFALLADVGPVWRFDAMRSIGERLAAAKETSQLESLCGKVAAPDKLGLLIGSASFFQDSGQFRKALVPQRLSLGLAQELQGPPLGPEASVSHIAADLALNLARTGQYDNAIRATELVAKPQERARIRREICVCQAEAGDIEAARETAESLSLGEGRAKAISSIAAVLGEDGHRRMRVGASGAKMQGAAKCKRMAEELMSASLQLARRIEDPTDWEVTFLWITTAAMKAHTYEAAAAAALMIRDSETQREAWRIIERA